MSVESIPYERQNEYQELVQEFATEMENCQQVIVTLEKSCQEKLQCFFIDLRKTVQAMTVLHDHNSAGGFDFSRTVGKVYREIQQCNGWKQTWFN